VPDINYTKEAFRNGYNFAFLIASGILAVLNPDLLPLIAGIALPIEGLYLLTIPGQAWFQRWVSLQKELDKKDAADSAKNQLIRSLSSSVRERYERLCRLKADIAQKCREKGQVCTLNPEDLAKLDSYLGSFLYFQQFRDQCVACKKAVDIEALQDNIHKLKRANEADRKDPTRQKVIKIREDNIKLTQEILDRVRRLDGYIDMVDAQIDAIENTLRVIQVRLVTAGFQAEGEVEVVSTDISHLLDGIRDTEKSIEEASRDMVKLRKLSQLDLRQSPESV
jgi:hypothetical protein